MASPSHKSIGKTPRFNKKLVVITQGSGDTSVQLINKDAGATAAVVELFRDSSSPATNDILYAIDFYGNDSAGNKTRYAEITAVITDATNGSEDCNLRFVTVVGGVEGNRLHIGNGIWADGATGGDPGAGKFNANDVNILGDSVLDRLIKAWVNFDASSGTPTIGDSLNVSSLDDDGVGLIGINLSITMGNTNYGFVGTARCTGAYVNVSVAPTATMAKTTTAFDIRTSRTSTDAAHDCTEVNVFVVGAV